MYLEVGDLSVNYRIPGYTVKAVAGVSFGVEKGEVVGIVGESGSGKSSLAAALMRILPANASWSGRALFEGEDIFKLNEEDFRMRYRWKTLSLVPQAAMTSLNPFYTVGEQMIEVMVERGGMTKKQALQRTQELFKVVGLGTERTSNYPHELSGGQKQRVAIAIALALNPSLLIADEPTTGLDVVVQAQVMRLLLRLKEEFGLTLILISHDIALLSQVCDRLLVMYAGRLVEMGPVETIVKEPSHPYTKLLIDSLPILGERGRQLTGIPGVPPDLRSPPPGCRFHLRCPYAIDICRWLEPALEAMPNGLVSACHRSGERLW